MTGISQTANQELRDVRKRDNHRNFTTSMRLIIRDVQEILLLFRKDSQGEKNPYATYFEESSLPRCPLPVSKIAQRW